MVVVQSGVQFSFVCQVVEEIGRLQSRRQICFLQVLQGEKSRGLAKSMEKTKQNRIKKHIISSPMANNSQSVPKWNDTKHSIFHQEFLDILQKSYNYVSTPTW